MALDELTGAHVQRLAGVGCTAAARFMNVLSLTQLAMLGPLGATELLVIGGVVLLLFGARKLPELAHSMGASINQFKRGLDAGKDDDEKPKKIEGGDA